jgi:hypothetical protein
MQPPPSGRAQSVGKMNGEINILNEENLFSAANKFYIFLHFVHRVSQYMHVMKTI